MSQNLNKRISQQKPNVSNIHNLEYLSVECRMPCSLFEHASCLIYNWCTYSTLNTSQLDARGVHGISAKFRNFQRRPKLLRQKRLLVLSHIKSIMMTHGPAYIGLFVWYDNHQLEVWLAIKPVIKEKVLVGAKISPNCVDSSRSKLTHGPNQNELKQNFFKHCKSSQKTSVNYQLSPLHPSCYIQFPSYFRFLKGQQNKVKKLQLPAALLHFPIRAT